MVADNDEIREPPPLPEEPLPPAPPIEAAPPQTGPAEQSLPYTLKSWFGYPLYACNYCWNTTFHEPDAWQHYAGAGYWDIHQRSALFRARWQGEPPPTDDEE